MSAIQDAGKKPSPTGQNYLQKTKTRNESMKITGAITDEKKKIENLYSEIGKKYCEVYKDTDEEPFKSMINEIDTSEKNIKEYEHRLKILNGAVFCTNCGSEIMSGSIFCNSCGVRVVPEDTTPEANIAGGNVCGVCGAVIAPDKSFCTRCGNKITPPDPAAQNLYPPQEQSAQANTVNCPVCGKEISADAGFCSGCGSRITSEQSVQPVQSGQPNANENPDGVIHCPKCNKALSSAAVFCSGCGEKLKGE